jgi:DNA-binding XRE family transcriptional regulator
MDLNLGKRIEIKRVTKDLNKTDFGKLIGISRQAVYNIEKKQIKTQCKKA